MALDPRLLAILACPVDKGPLYYLEPEGALYNPRLKKKYRVEHDVPQMLVEEAVDVDPAEDARLLATVRERGVTLNFTP